MRSSIMHGVQDVTLFFALAVMLSCAVKGGLSSGISGIRLVGGANAKEGRVEVLYQGVWGTVCDDSFNNNAARVVCASIGHPNANAVARCCAPFGQGTGRITLDDVRCNGDEASLNDCQHRTILTHNCAHSEDVGVDCSPSVWSGWYDRDDPSATADGELLEHIPQHPCGGRTPELVQVQVLTRGSWRNLLTTNVMIHVGPVYGLVCVNSENRWIGGACRDFEIRHSINKGNFWFRSPWFDRDNPSGNGDYEWGYLQSEPLWAAHGTSVEFRTKPSSQAVSHMEVDRFVHVGANWGFRCWNKENTDLGLPPCRDYRTRYLCPG